MKQKNPYDKKYSKKGYYWGRQPSASCDRLLEYVQSVDWKPLSLIDIGCGEGRNAVYFASRGFEVTGLDSSRTGLTKMQQLAGELGVWVEALEADILEYRLNEQFDVIFSTGTLHYLPPDLRDECFTNYRDFTSPDGVNAHSVFVEKPFIPRAPDADDVAYVFRSGELLGYYWDWEILYSIEEIFDCMSGGILHRHAVNRIIARKP